MHRCTRTQAVTHDCTYTHTQAAAGVDNPKPAKRAKKEGLDESVKQENKQLLELIKNDTECKRQWADILAVAESKKNVRLTGDSDVWLFIRTFICRSRMVPESPFKLSFTCACRFGP